MSPVTIVVPVLRRPQNAEPFMASLEASIDDALPPVLALVNGGDDETRRAWDRSWAYTATCTQEPGSFGQKANQAAGIVGTDWMFLVGDDVAFQPGWLHEALRDIPDHICVVGTNDLGTPHVQAGDHATHMLIRMDYIREQGASWDGPGTVAGPYRHWWTDNEMVTVAKQRGVWTSRPKSIVEHRHPYFGRGEMDDVYRLGEEASGRDATLWASRVRKFAPELLSEPM